jgi:DNA repair protein RadC
VFAADLFEAAKARPEAGRSEPEAKTNGAQGAKPSRPRHGGVGHRGRLRERALAGGVAALPDYELLELLLFRSIPQRDVKPLAKALLARFGSFSGVLGAPVADLVKVRATDSAGRGLGLADQTALDLKLLHEASTRMAREGLRKREVISSWSALNAYLKVALAHEPREQFRVLFLDKKNQLIADVVMNEGTVDHAPVYPREVVRKALDLASSALILVHNHPSGDPTPSSADVEMTRQIVDAARALGLVVHDHLVVGRDGVSSLKALGLM